MKLREYKTVSNVCIDLLPITVKLLEFVGSLILLLTACPWCWGETLFCSTHLKWDYAKRCIDGVMPQHIQKALIRFQHPHSACPQHSPQKYTPTSYGNNPWTDPDDTRYYSHAFNPTLSYVLNAIATNIQNGTQAVLDTCHQLPSYDTTHPNATT